MKMLFWTVMLPPATRFNAWSNAVVEVPIAPVSVISEKALSVKLPPEMPLLTFAFPRLELTTIVPATPPVLPVAFKITLVPCRLEVAPMMKFCAPRLTLAAVPRPVTVTPLIAD